MERKRERKISKFLDYVLRHDPEAIGIDLDGEGWAEVDELLDACARSQSASVITREELEFVVANNKKQRFAMSEDGSRIRAQYGHSVGVNPDYVPTEPPEMLFHGTARGNLMPIRQHGLASRGRRYVHLSLDHETAL